MSDQKQGKSVKPQTSKHTKVDKSKAKAEHKEQDKQAPSQGLHGRTGSDAFAYGLSKALSDIESSKGSRQAFLGKESQVLDPKEHTEDKTKLPIKKGK